MPMPRIYKNDSKEQFIAAVFRVTPLLWAASFGAYLAFRPALWTKILFGGWFVGPAIWFVYDFVTYDNWEDTSALATFKHAQDVVAKLWIAMMALWAFVATGKL